MTEKKNLGGRPPYDLDKLADELLYWSSDPSALNLIGFSRPRRISVTMLPAWAKSHQRFSEALRLAKESIAVNRFEAACANEMPHVFFTRSEGLYDPLHHRYDREQKEFESSLRTKENKTNSGDVYVSVNPKLAGGANIRATRLPNPADNSSE